MTLARCICEANLRGAWFLELYLPCGRLDFGNLHAVVATWLLEVCVRTGCVGSWFLRGVYRRSRLSSWGCTYFRGRLVLGNTITCRCGRHVFASVPTVNQSTRRPDATYTSKNRWDTTAGETSKTIVGTLPKTMTTTVGPLPRYTSKHPDCNGA